MYVTATVRSAVRFSSASWLLERQSMTVGGIRAPNQDSIAVGELMQALFNRRREIINRLGVRLSGHFRPDRLRKLTGKVSCAIRCELS